MARRRATRNWLPLSNEFCLPVRLSVSPRPLGAAVVAAYCLPLPLLLAAPTEWGAHGAWAALAFAAAALTWEWRRRRAAASAVALEALVDYGGGENWLLHRRDGSCARARLLDCMDFGGFFLLLVGQNGKTFHLAARPHAHDNGDRHRLRVLWKWAQSPRAPQSD